MVVRLALALAMIVVPRTENSPSPTVHTPEIEQRLNLALEAFETAGLELPEIEVRFAPDPTSCRGHDGYFQPKFSPWRLTICSERDYVLLHELAHAWAEARLDDAKKQRFVDRLGLPSWNDKGDDWGDRGTEVAAFTIQQNLEDRVVPNSRTWRQRMADFEFLTGQRSPLRAAR
ncbi:MAG: hypothetical protein ACR2NL_07895 [Acidimicrobiia bacterium]